MKRTRSDSRLPDCGVRAWVDKACGLSRALGFGVSGFLGIVGLIRLVGSEGSYRFGGFVGIWDRDWEVQGTYDPMLSVVRTQL